MQSSLWFLSGSRRSGLSRPGRRQSEGRKSARPWLEGLESRLTPDSTIHIVSGVLTVDCDNAVNTVTVDHAGSTTTVNGQPFADASFNSIRINMGTGGGTVNLNATPAKPA